MARKTSRYKKRDSDRSGFTYKRIELVKDDGNLVGPDEYDSPPPSKIPLGGEGEVSQGEVRADYDTSTTPAENDYTVHYITAAGGVSFTRDVYLASNEVKNSGWMKIAGSGANITISADPQISAGLQSDFLTLECVGSNVVISNGTGVSLYNTHINMASGDLITFVYNTGDTVWQETSRGKTFGSKGAF